MGDSTDARELVSAPLHAQPRGRKQPRAERAVVLKAKLLVACLRSIRTLGEIVSADAKVLAGAGVVDVGGAQQLTGAERVVEQIVGGPTVSGTT